MNLKHALALLTLLLSSAATLPAQSQGSDAQTKQAKKITKTQSRNKESAIAPNEFLGSLTAEDRNVYIMKQLYTKIEGVMAPRNTPVPSQTFLVLLNPGIVIKPGMDMNKPDDHFEITKEFDVVTIPDWMYNPAAVDLATIWGEILRAKDLPIVDLTDPQKKKLKDAKKVLFDGDKPSKTVINYQAYEDAYASAIDALAAAEAQSKVSGSPVPTAVRNAVPRAMNNWQAYGSKNIVEAAQSDYTQFTGLQPGVWWTEIAHRRQTNVETLVDGSTVPKTDFGPPYSTWFDDKSWGTFTFDDKEADTLQTSHSTSVGGGASGGWGLWHASLSASYSRNENHSTADVKSFNISMDVMRVTIRRPWLDPYVFRSHQWRWAPSQGTHNNISDGNGDIAQAIAPTGDMPFYITGVLLARNVKVHGIWNSEELKHWDMTTTSSGSVGWGPFAVSGYYSDFQQETHYHGNFTSDGFDSPPVQIIGYYVEVLPQTPYPDKKLHWEPPLTLKDFNLASTYIPEE